MFHHISCLKMSAIIVHQTTNYYCPAAVSLMIGRTYDASSSSDNVLRDDEFKKLGTARR